MLGLFTAAIPAVQWAMPVSFSGIYSGSDRIRSHWKRRSRLVQEQEGPCGGRITRNLVRGLPWAFTATKLLTTDTSAWGWGSHLGEQTAQGEGSKVEARRSSDWRELRAIHLGLFFWRSLETNMYRVCQKTCQ